LKSGSLPKSDLARLKSLLGNLGCAIPPLYKQYSEVCEPGGVQFIELQPGQVVVVILPAKLRQHIGQRRRIRATGLRQRLYKQYSEVCEPGGVQFIDFGSDPDFNNCVDGLVLDPGRMAG
jgi:hypothetical protein